MIPKENDSSVIQITDVKRKKASFDPRIVEVSFGSDSSIKSEQEANEKPVYGTKPGGGGGDGTMADRLEALEKKVVSIETSLTRLNESITRIEAKFDLQAVKSTSELELQSTKLSSSLDLQGQKLSSAMDLQSQKLSGALELQAQKLTSALENQSLSFDGKLKDQKISIILWVLGLPSFIFGMYKVISMITNSPS